MIESSLRKTFPTFCNILFYVTSNQKDVPQVQVGSTGLEEHSAGGAGLGVLQVQEDKQGSVEHPQY